MKRIKGAKVQKGAIQGAMHPRCKGAIPYIGIAPFVAPIHQAEVQQHSRHELAEEIITTIIRDAAKGKERT
jgi:hypothetical protein